MAEVPSLSSLDVLAMPLPIANAVYELEASLNPHERRDRLVEVFRATLRTLGGMALAARIAVGPGPKRPSGEVDARLLRLRRQALTDGEWVGLSRELLRPWQAVAETHPTPRLVEIFVGRKSKVHDGLDALLGMRKRETVAHGTTGTETEVEATYAERLPQLVDLLAGLQPLWVEARFVVPLERPADDMSVRQRAWLLHGPTPLRGRWRVVELAAGVRCAPGRPVLLDQRGSVRLPLEPVVRCERPSPEQPEDLFFLDGRDKKTAVFAAFPSMAEVRHGDVLEALDRALTTSEGEDANDLTVLRGSPYLGLASFGPEDVGVFVGREKLVEELTNRILVNPWVTITGASGSGKTSLLAAGVGPALRTRVEREREAAGYRGESVDYAIASLRPGSDPMAALASKLDAELGIALERDDEPAWARRITDWCSARRRVLVLIVDQAEELLTQCHDVARREAFGALLVELTSRSETPVRLVLSLRVDFMAQLATIRTLGDRYQHATQVVTTPERDDLLRILVEPATRFGATWEEGLSARIVDEVKKNPSALPLMSFVASELWKRRGEDGVLSREAYEALGGVAGALATHADEVVARLTDHKRRTVRALLLRLITPEGTRDLVPTRELEDAAEASEESLLAMLVEKRLLSSRELADGEAALELVHEALLEHWPQLRAWRNEDVEAEVHHARLRVAVREWVVRGRLHHALWRGEALAEHQAIVKRRGDTLRLTADERVFVRASAALARRVRWIAGTTIAVVVIVFAVLAVLAAEQSRQAEMARSDAEAAREGAEERALIAEGRGLIAEALAQDDEIVAAVLMAAAAELSPELVRFAAERGSELKAFRPMPRVLPLSTAFGGLMAYSRDGGTVCAAGGDGVTFWDARTGAERRTEVAVDPRVLRRDLSDGLLACSPDGTASLTVERTIGSRSTSYPQYEPIARIWDARSGAERASLRGHEHGISAVAYAPDGMTILTGSRDRTARLWDATTGVERVVLRGHEDSISSVAYGPDGLTVLTGSKDGTARLWDGRTGIARAVLRGHEDSIHTVAYAPDGTTVLTGSSDGTTRLWDPRMGGELAVVTHHGTEATALDYSRDGTTALLGLSDGTARLWDVRTKAERAVLRHNDAYVFFAQLAPDGMTALTGSEDGTAHLWDAWTGVVRTALPPILPTVLLGRHQLQSPVTVAYSPDGATVFTDHIGIGASLWDVHSGAERAVLRDGSSRGRPVLAANGSTIVTGTEDGTVGLWDAQTGHSRAVLEGHDAGISDAVFAPDGATFLTGSRDGTARLWDTMTGAERRVFRHGSSIDVVAYAPDGSTVVTGSDDWRSMSLHVWDARTGAERVGLRGESFLGYSPDSATVLTRTHALEGRGRLWDVRTGTERVLRWRERAVWGAFAFAPEGATLLTSQDGHRALWDTQTGAMRAEFPAPEGKVMQVVFAPDGASVLEVLSWGRARVWNPTTGAERMLEHGGWFRRVAYAPNGTTFLTVSDDFTVRTWDAQTGAGLVVLEHDDSVSSALYSPDGATVLTVSSSQARLWDARTGAPRAAFPNSTHARYSPDGATVMTRFNDGAVRLWDVRVAPLAGRTNLRVCRGSHEVIVGRVPADAEARRRFNSTLWAADEECEVNERP